MDELVKALRAGEQADMDGTLVKVSRQACEEAADAIEALQAELADEHERLTAGRDAEIARLREARILVLPNGHTGVCVGGRFNGWLMHRHSDGQWVSVVKLQEVDPTSANPALYSLVGAIARAALGDDNG